MKQVLISVDNPSVRRWRKLARNARFRRAESRSWLEGVTLVREYCERLGMPPALIVSEAALKRQDIAALVARYAPQVRIVSQRVFEHLAVGESPSGLAAEIETGAAAVDPDRSCVFLEGIQDPGNIGSLLRNAAAFGLTQAVLDHGCADPWSPRSLRAGAGAQLYLRLQVCESIAEALKTFRGERLCTVLRDGEPLPTQRSTRPLGWIFGNEGHGLSPPVLALADRRITIPMRSGIESLNVASAAAICFFAFRATEQR